MRPNNLEIFSSNSFDKFLDLSGSIALIGKGGSLNIGYASAKSSSENYINSLLSAGGDFNLNSGGDTNIISSNILASDVNMVVAGDLNLESRQNTSDSKAYSFGIGGGFSTSGGGNSGSGNLSYSKSTSERDWVDNQASILGTNSVTINVGENTNLVGSVIANSTNGQIGSDGIDGGNLTLNTNSLTFSNLSDNDQARSFGIGLGGNTRFGGGAGSIKGSGSLSLDYSMHDFEQDTNAVIGNGDIKTGTVLNLDSDNNLISVSGGNTYDGDINRNIQTAQVETKHLEVDPIHIKETFEFGRNSTSSQMKADGKTSSERPTIWSDLANEDKSKSLTSSITSGLLTNAQITLEELAYQANPLRGFSNIIDGISTDMKNIRTELGIKTQTLDVGQDRQFVTVDKDGNILNKFTFEQYLQNPSLAANKLFSNGIMNNLTEAISNGQAQLKSTDESGRITILFDPTAFPDDKNAPTSQKIAGFFSDIGEVSVNYLGANVLGGLIQTKGQATDQKFIAAVTENAKANGTEITLAGHSGGGLRNYLTLANSAQGQYLDSTATQF